MIVKIAIFHLSISLPIPKIYVIKLYKLSENTHIVNFV